MRQSTQTIAVDAGARPAAGVRATLLQKTLVILAHAVLGWAWCGALVGVGRQFLPLEATLWVHAAGAPIGFALITLLYQRRFGYSGPLATAAAFLGVVVGLDVFLVAPVFERSYAMFASLLGTWIPFALIFLAVWATSRLAARRHDGGAGHLHRAPAGEPRGGADAP